MDLLAVQEDLPLVRACEPVEDVHQGGLAGPVLAQQGVDLTGPHVEVDAVIGDDARVPLGDAAHLERGRVDQLGLRRHVSLHGRQRRGWSERAGLTAGPLESPGGLSLRS
jgi:hypothetical protein